MEDERDTTDGASTEASAPWEDHHRSPVDVVDEVVVCSIKMDQVIVTLANHAVLRPSGKTQRSLELAVKSRQTLDELVDLLFPSNDEWGRLGAHVHAIHDSVEAVRRAVASATADLNAAPGFQRLRENLEIGLKAQNALWDFYHVVSRRPTDVSREDREPNAPELGG